MLTFGVSHGAWMIEEEEAARKDERQRNYEIWQKRLGRSPHDSLVARVALTGPDIEKDVAQMRDESVEPPVSVLPEEVQPPTMTAAEALGWIMTRDRAFAQVCRNADGTGLCVRLAYPGTKPPLLSMDAASESLRAKCESGAIKASGQRSHRPGHLDERELIEAVKWCDIALSHNDLRAMPIDGRDSPVASPDDPRARTWRNLLFARSEVIYLWPAPELVVSENFASQEHSEIVGRSGGGGNRTVPDQNAATGADESLTRENSRQAHQAPDTPPPDRSPAAARREWLETQKRRSSGLEAPLGYDDTVSHFTTNFAIDRPAARAMIKGYKLRGRPPAAR